MRNALKRWGGVFVLLTLAFTAGLGVSAAHAGTVTYTDIGLAITANNTVCHNGGISFVTPATGPAGTDELTVASGDTLSVHAGDGLTIGGTGTATLTFSGSVTEASNPGFLVVDESNGSGCVEAFVYTLPASATTNFPAGGPFPTLASVPDIASLTGPFTPAGGPEFGGSSSDTSNGGGGAGNTGTFTYSVPAGVVISGRQLVVTGSTAVPNVYTNQSVSYADADGAIQVASFTLTVTGIKTFTYTPGNLGDEVNAFGNGFDVFRQHYAVNAVIAGWTATQGDPATHFVRISRGAGVWQFEAVNGKGIATGLCVSMPGFDAAGTGLADGLVLRGCNSGPWQEFAGTATDSTLVNVATHMVVWPDGTGAQLRGSLTAIPGVSNLYTWMDTRQLP